MRNKKGQLRGVEFAAYLHCFGAHFNSYERESECYSRQIVLLIPWREKGCSETVTIKGQDMFSLSMMSNRSCLNCGAGADEQSRLVDGWTCI